MSRGHAILTLAVAGAALPLSSAAAITTPQIAPLAPFTSGEGPTRFWSPATLDASAVMRRYQLAVKIPSTDGGPQTLTNVSADQIWRSLLLQNGHQYVLKVRAQQLVDPAGPALAMPVSRPWSTPWVTRVDTTPPVGAIQIDGGRQSVNTRNVRLALTATDPLSAGFTPSGIATYSIAANTSACAGGASCWKPYVASHDYTLEAGPDGPRTVYAWYRDSAVPLCNPKGLTPGNKSARAEDTVLLERLAPTARLAALPARIVVGATVAFNAAGSTDRVGGPNDSGTDPFSYTRTAGDGTALVGAAQHHKYAAAGTYIGTRKVRDRAGNLDTQSFGVVVTGDALTATPGTAKTSFSLGKIRLIGKARALRTVRIRVNVSAAVGLRGRLTRTVRRRTTVVRRFAVGGGPGTVAMSFRAPKAGFYRIVVSAGDLSRTRALRVTRWPAGATYTYQTEGERK